MKSLKNHYSVFTTIGAFLFLFILSANAFASSDMFLQIEGLSGEGIYKCPVDQTTGACDFKDVKPGKYKVTLMFSNPSSVSPGVKPNDNGTPSTIEISSFSWGVSNSSSMASGSGLGSGKASFSSFSTMKAGGEELPKESLSLDRSAITTAPPSTRGFTNKTCQLTCRKAGSEQKDYYTVRFGDITIPGAGTSNDRAAGTVKPGYDVKACVKI